MVEYHAYIFSGTPRHNLSAGGLQFCIEEVENLGLLVHDDTVGFRKDGVYRVSKTGAEWMAPYQAHMSDRLVEQGLTFDLWFRPDKDFSNGVFVTKTTAEVEYKTVIQGTNLSEDEYLERYGPTMMRTLVKERKMQRPYGRRKYEGRWLPGMCPTRTHNVRMTMLFFDYKLPDHICERIRRLVEDPSVVLVEPERYDNDKRHMSPTRVWRPKDDFQELQNKGNRPVAQ